MRANVGRMSSTSLAMPLRRGRPGPSAREARGCSIDDTLPKFADETAMFQWIAAHLYTAVVSDACDAAGLRSQSVWPDIRPLDESLVLVGRAKTVVWAPMFHIPERPYDREIAAVDSLKPGEVMVMTTGRSREIVPWGELLSTATVARGGRGVVLDGLIRDAARIKEMKLPVFCTGRRPLDSRGRGIVVDYDVPIAIDGVEIMPGDLILGDGDGVIVVPRAREQEILGLAWSKVDGEDTTRRALLEGRSVADVFREHGIL
jgi:4-hydroxy-4-methyl-2-oxoglutarate aldolase